MIPIQKLKLKVPRHEEIRNEAIQLLINHLGLTKSAFFIRETWSQPEDYLKMKEPLFGEQTAAELFNEIKHHSQASSK